MSESTLRASEKRLQQSLATNIKRRRLKLRLTICDASIRAQMDEFRWEELERGELNATLADLWWVSVALKIDASVLLIRGEANEGDEPILPDMPERRNPQGDEPVLPDMQGRRNPRKRKRY